MLARLSIRDIVLIDRLELDFEGGLSVLTGETGAGKSIVLDAVSLALGGRGDGGLVREGEAQGQVTAAFDLAPGHPARALLKAQDIDDDGDVILRRVQARDGRTRAFANDQPVSVQTLKSLGALLVEIHGQHDDRALVDPAAHRALLDAYGGLGQEAEAVRSAWTARRAAEKALGQHAERVEAARREADYLKHASEELSALAPEYGEEEQLADRRAAMMRSEKAAEDLNEAYEAVTGGAGPASAIANAIRRLERRAAASPELVEPAIKALDAALVALDEGEQHIKAALEATAFDPRELERLEERLFALRAASRKYGVPADQLAALAKKYKHDLAEIDAGEARLAALGAEAEAARHAYAAAAERLSAARRKVAATLDAAVMAELPDLKLERARFTTEVEPDTAGPEGVDRVEFWVQTNPGTRAGPLAKIASGGELSRFMLALKVALADRGSAPTLVFDEIDTGVGGAVADAIGARLARLARTVQVLSVTHAPQVAARAGSHFLISKAQAPGETRVVTRVAGLERPERKEEIARMLAGASVTEEARAAAARLLEGAA
ncbi:DNA repair protein RecN [Chenggangzhangella methanolivorans]|uniref:DNA repair protein RecN n=1 Tax=Chenggangzhangella methanolivorans TaxID=1437009 RepID=A0A9E6RH02_9HYPH|nr:DNA repair protein RecN [Chenggangzhangella methanolivorans]QZO00862.1 DNA repair protein RecN [Chenggangzhangella methanolivorans]